MADDAQHYRGLIVQPFLLVDADGNPVSLSGGGGGAATQSGYTATATFTPTAAAYAANDIMDVAKALAWYDKSGTIFGGGELLLTSAVLQIAATALQVSEGAYSLGLYGVTPPSATADNGAWDVPSGDRAAFIDLIGLGVPVDLGSTLQIATDSINKQITVGATGTSYGELITVAGFTATAVARKITLHGIAV